MAKKTSQNSLATLYGGDKGYTPKESVTIGGVVLRSEQIEYNAGRPTTKLRVRNRGDRPIQVGSHFHFFEVNRYLEFDRAKAFGTHLNIPATTAIRFEPGDEREVEVVPFAGKQRLIGFNSLTMGYAGTEDDPVYYPTRAAAFARMHRGGFACCCNEKCNKTSKS